MQLIPSMKHPHPAAVSLCSSTLQEGKHQVIGVSAHVKPDERERGHLSTENTVYSVQAPSM